MPTSDKLAELIDIGANLTHESFAADLPEVLQRARDAGVAQMVVTGADEPHSRQAAELAAAHPGLLAATAGIHPHHADQCTDATIGTLRELCARPEVVAVGETGLDFFRDFSPREVQEKRFCEHIELAIELQMPMFLHMREAHARFHAILREFRDRLPAVVVHCFTGQEHELREYLELDCHIGITGWICDERRGQHLREFVHLVPAGRLMVETDAPYLLPRDLRPKPKTRRNEPMHLAHILGVLAQVRGEPPEYTAEHTTRTARAFFRLPRR